MLLTSFLASPLNVYAVTKTDEDLAKTKILNYIDNAGIKRSLISVVDLYNLSGERIAQCYSLEPQGYFIVSVSGETLEYSLETSSPYPKTSDIYYYNGFLEYYVNENGRYISTVTKESYSVSQITSNKSLESFSNPDKTFYPLSGINYVLPGTPSTIAATTSNGWYCTITGVAILLDYYERYKGGGCFRTGITSANELRSYLNSAKYIYNGGLLLSEAAAGGTENGVYYKGLRSYFNNATGVTAKSVYINTYSLQSIIDHIYSSRRPVLIDINTSAISPGAKTRHIVFAYGLGYDAVLSSAQMIIVNNGWGDNNIWINSSILLGHEILYLP
jgi:hypothetical protein